MLRSVEIDSRACVLSQRPLYTEFSSVPVTEQAPEKRISLNLHS
jgi:hypothetical protein